MKREGSGNVMSLKFKVLLVVNLVVLVQSRAPTLFSMQKFSTFEIKAALITTFKIYANFR